MAEISWINHASFLIEDAGVRLVCDPWLTGTAFNRGWRLTSPTTFTPADFSGVTHIWFSHQHPDHFSPSDLRKIAPETRANITVLYHETIDKKIVRFCRGMGFREAIELKNDGWYPLSPRVQVLCNGWSEGDSWMALRTPEATLLNLNDCVVNTRELANSIARLVPHVDVLLTQFSYANWIGNPDDVELRRRSAREKLERLRLQCEVFKPRQVIPFASFVWFCHVENFYHNPEMNRIGDVVRFLREELCQDPIVLYPGDRWRAGDPRDCSLAIQRYETDFAERLAGGPSESTRSVEYAAIERAMSDFLKRIKRRNPLLTFIPGLTSTVDITDLGKRVRLSIDGIKDVVDDGTPADIALASESLLFALKTPWGSNALHVNGRFRAPQGGNMQRFFHLFRSADLNDHGYGFDFTWLRKTIAARISRRIATRMRIGTR
jgi:UDP-MurNAc hydroxylase